MNDAVSLSTQGHVLWIRLNRPDALNAIDAAMIAGLQAAWHRLATEHDLRVGVVIGEGTRAFSVGADIKAGTQPTDLARILPGIGVEVEKPLIAAVSGHCVGGGLVLALGCDLRIATHSARFAYPEPKIGTTGGNASTLTRYMPHAIAMEMLFTGDPLPAERAYQTGFVNRLTDEEDLERVAGEMATRIAANAPLVVQTMKRLVRLGEPRNPIEQAGVVDRLLADIRGSEDEAEGRAAFREKRPPKFNGRPSGQHD